MAGKVEIVLVDRRSYVFDDDIEAVELKPDEFDFAAYELDLPNDGPEDGGPFWVGRMFAIIGSDRRTHSLVEYIPDTHPDADSYDEINVVGPRGGAVAKRYRPHVAELVRYLTGRPWLV